jgi:hypothetical protein
MAMLGFLAQSSQVLNLSGAAVNLAATTQALLSPENQDENLPKGINDFVFDIPLSESITLTAEITDHYTEANIAIQDHVALQPVKVTLTGQVGELFNERDKIFEYAEQAIQKLLQTPWLNPEQSRRAVQYLASYNEIKRQVQQTLKIYNTAKKLFGANQVSQTRQQEKYAILEGYFNSRTLCSIVTPWRTGTIPDKSPPPSMPHLIGLEVSSLIASPSALALMRATACLTVDMPTPAPVF